jgi:hypothetical protein
MRPEPSHVDRGGLSEAGIIAGGIARGEMSPRTGRAASSARSPIVRLTSLASW